VFRVRINRSIGLVFALMTLSFGPYQLNASCSQAVRTLVKAPLLNPYFTIGRLTQKSEVQKMAGWGATALIKKPVLNPKVHAAICSNVLRGIKHTRNSDIYKAARRHTQRVFNRYHQTKIYKRFINPKKVGAFRGVLRNSKVNRWLYDGNICFTITKNELGKRRYTTVSRGPKNHWKFAFAFGIKTVAKYGIIVPTCKMLARTYPNIASKLKNAFIALV